MPITLSPYAQNLYEEINKIPEEDEALAKLVQAMAAPMEQGAVARGIGDEDLIPYQSVMAPSTAPEWALRWLGQMVGVTVPSGTSEADAREMILLRFVQQRGKPETIRQVVRTFLTDTQEVFLEENADGNPFHFRIYVLTSEVPDPVDDPARIKAAVTAIKPASYTFELLLTTGLAWAAAVGQWNAALGTWESLGQPPKP